MSEKKERGIFRQVLETERMAAIMRELEGSSTAYGIIQPASAVAVTEAPNFVDNAYTYELLERSPGISLVIEDGGEENEITIQLPTGLANIRQTLMVAVSLTANAGSACKAKLAGLDPVIYSGGVFSDLANGIYFLFCPAAIDGIAFWEPITSLVANE